MWPAVIAALVLLLIIWMAAPRPVQVKVAPVTQGDLPLFLSATGVVDGNVSDVGARITARINSLLVDEGDKVTKGQPLATLDKSDLQAQVAQAQAAVQAAQNDVTSLQTVATTSRVQARAEADIARSNYQRAQTLYQKGAISAQQLDQARTTWQAAQAALQQTAARQSDVAAAKSRLKQAQAALQTSQALLGYATIYSPITGVVASRHKEVGEIATPADPIYTIANLSGIYVTAEIDEEDVAAAAIGEKVAITLDAYPGKEAKGVITEMSGIAEPKEVGRVRAKIVRTRIDITQSAIPLRPGMEVNITGSHPVGQTTVLAPNDAVTRVGEQDSVYVIENNEVARLRQVQIGQSNFQSTQILSGLQVGEQVAVTNLDQLSDGKRVKVVK